MKRFAILLALAGATAFAFTDLDLDGVDDSVDACPNTPITDIVDKRGCSIESVIDTPHYDLIVGLSYSQYNYRYNDDSDTVTTSLQADYYKGNFSAQFSTSYYSTDGGSYSADGMNDTTLAGYYTFKNVRPALDVQLGGGLVFPTYDATYGNNKLDLFGSVHASYRYKRWTFFGGYTYTLVGDDDVEGEGFVIRYQNTNAFNVGAGYGFGPKLYASLSYFYSDSIYEGVDGIKNVSLYTFYSLDANWFVTGSYARGLNDTTSDHYLSLRLGYYF